MTTPRPTIADLQRLVGELVFPFYQVHRDTPLRFAKGRVENDAEHSWSLTLLACALAPQVDPKLDIGKISQFAVIHDLIEVYAGDTSNFAAEEHKATKEAREHAALKRLVEEYKAFPWLGETVIAYERQDSDEARYVKSVDKVITLLYDYIEEGLFYHERKITRDQWKVIMQKHRDKARGHAGAFKYYEEVRNLILESPQFFHSE